VLVFDGNCKNFRDVCKARDAGYVEYKGLQGIVKTGCMNSPKLQSRFCELHTENIGTVTPHQLDADSTDSQSVQEESVVAMIMGKRSTRSDTYYQVCMCRYSYQVYMSVAM
jgi:hypothetical protein